MTNNAFTIAPNIVKGSLYAILAFFFMAIFGILTKIACEHGDPIWVSFITYTTATLGTAIFILPRGITGLKSQHYPYLIARAVIGTTASFLYMMSMHYISIVNSTLLFNTAPIFIPFLTVFVLKGQVPKKVWYAVFLGFVGILAIIKPQQNIFTDPGNLIGLAAGFSLAIAYLIMKMLTSTDTGLRIIFYYFSIGTLIQIPLLLLAKKNPSPETLVPASLCGILLMMGQMSLVKAYQYAAASQVGVYQYMSVVFVAIIEWLLWSITPGFLTYMGFILVSLAGIFIISSSGPQSPENSSKSLGL